MNVALTGNIGSGKSTVEKIFQSMHLDCIDCDHLVSDIYAKEANFRDAVRLVIGKESFINGEVNRPYIANAIFNNQPLRAEIGTILRPYLKKRIDNFLKESTANIKCVAIPLLFESQWQDLFDKTISIWAYTPTRLKRLCNQRKMKYSDALKREHSQMSQDKKLELADYGIINSHSHTELEAQCQILIKKLSA